MAKAQPKADVRTKAIAATTEVIARQGFAAVTVQEIADRVGVSKQALLYHFKSKDALMNAVIDGMLGRANVRLTQMFDKLPRDDEKRVDAVLEHVGAYLEDEPHAAAVFMRLLLDADPAAIARIRKGARPWFLFIEDIVRTAQKEGLVRPELDPEETVVQISMLVITNFALLRVGTWHRSPPRHWKKKRLHSLVRTVGGVLFVRR